MHYYPDRRDFWTWCRMWADAIDPRYLTADRARVTCPRCLARPA